jgi:hypothetical protein
MFCIPSLIRVSDCPTQRIDKVLRVICLKEIEIRHDRHCFMNILVEYFRLLLADKQVYSHHANALRSKLEHGAKKSKGKTHSG